VKKCQEPTLFAIIYILYRELQKNEFTTESDDFYPVWQFIYSNCDVYIAIRVDELCPLKFDIHFGTTCSCCTYIPIVK
jgi:hypothetical protein